MQEEKRCKTCLHQKEKHAPETGDHHLICSSEVPCFDYHKWTPKQEQPNYDILREQLLLILESKTPKCNLVRMYFSQIKDYETLEKAFEDSVRNLCSHFGVEYADQDEIRELEDEVYDLEQEKKELEREIEGFEEFEPITTVAEEYKVKAFNEYRGKYSWWELEYLLREGKLPAKENQ